MSTHMVPATFGSKKKSWLKRPVTWVVAGVVVAAFAVGGAVGGKPEPVVTQEPEAVQEPVQVEEPAEPVEVEQPSLEEIGLIALRETDPYFIPVPDDVIIDTAWSVCDVFSTGGTFEMVVMVGVGEGLTPEAVGALTGFAVNVYCPEYLGVLG